MDPAKLRSYLLLKCLRKFSSRETNFQNKQIQAETVRSTDHLTPEISLRLITPQTRLWSANSTTSPFTDPFWAFYWPGGQALSRYILDNPNTVRNKKVLDLGCGGGASGIASLMGGAEEVIFNDVDKVALEATAINLCENGCSSSNFSLNFNNLIAQNHIFDWDVVLVGDVLYESEFSDLVFKWLQLVSERRIDVLIGDPGRHAFSEVLKRQSLNSSSLRCLGRYELPHQTLLENRGFPTAFCWKFTS